MKIRVLIADDFPLTRMGIASSLKRDPAIEVVGEAQDGVDALALAHELRPDVIVLDLQMPGIGGIEVLHMLREELPETRALITTASESPESLIDAISAGAAGYLSKRTSGEALRQAVITIHGGGSVIMPELAGHLFREVSTVANEDSPAPRRALSDRELAILRLVARGHTDDEIGRELFISPRTVQNHLARIRDKTGTRRRAELARWAAEHAMA
jgi:DNA-binding NarL/FixJ family response regulator